MSKGRFEGLFPEKIESKKDYVHAVIEAGLWTEKWALETVLHHLTDDQIDKILTYENIPLDIEFYTETVTEKKLVAKHDDVLLGGK